MARFCKFQENWVVITDGLINENLDNGFIEVTKKDGSYQTIQINELLSHQNGKAYYTYKKITNVQAINPEFWQKILTIFRYTKDSELFEQKLKGYTDYKNKNSIPIAFFGSIENAIKNNYYKHKFWIQREYYSKQDPNFVPNKITKTK